MPTIVHARWITDVSAACAISGQAQGRGSWFAAELGQATLGTVNSCDLASSSCEVVAELPLPTGVASNRRRTFATTLALVPGEADVVRIA